MQEAWKVRSLFSSTGCRRTRRFQGFKVSRFLFLHTPGHKQNQQAMNSSPRWAEWSHLETQANSTTRHIVNKKVPNYPKWGTWRGTISSICNECPWWNNTQIQKKEKKRKITGAGQDYLCTAKRKSRYIRQDLWEWLLTRSNEIWIEGTKTVMKISTKGEDNFHLLCTIRWHKQFLNFPFEFRERSHFFDTCIEPVPNLRSSANHTVACANKFSFFTINMISVPSTILMLGITDWN